MRKKSQLNEQGFGIIEVVVTLFIIAVTLLLFESTANSIILNRYGRYRETALRIADKEMQTLRANTFADLPPSGSFSDPLLSSLPDAQAQLDIADVSNLLKDVTVTVSWVNPDSSNRQQVQLRTYITQGGIGQWQDDCTNNQDLQLLNW